MICVVVVVVFKHFLGRVVLIKTNFNTNGFSNKMRLGTCTLTDQIHHENLESSSVTARLDFRITIQD